MTDTFAPDKQSLAATQPESYVQSITEQEKGSALQSKHIDSVAINSGEPVSPDHPFFQLVNSIYTRLSEHDSKLVSLDSDSPDAYNSNFAQVMLLSRGLLARIQTGGLEITEDHIAAIIAHENNHANRGKNSDELSEQKLIKKAVTYKTAGHAEEHQSDRKAMTQIAEAGYNPRAMIDVLEAFRDIWGDGISGSHPFLTDRINHLKRIMFDDERPLAGTDREYVPIGDDMREWINHGDPDVYAFTDRMLELRSVEEVNEALSNVGSTSEFFQLLRYKRQLVRGEQAKVLRKSDSFNDLARKSLALNAIRNITDAVNRGSMGREYYNLASNLAFDFYPDLDVSSRYIEQVGKGVNNFMIEKDDTLKTGLFCTATQRFFDDKDLSRGELPQTQSEQHDKDIAEVVGDWDKGLAGYRDRFKQYFEPLTDDEQQQIKESWQEVFAPIPRMDADNGKQQLMLRHLLDRATKYYEGDTEIDEDLVRLALMSFDPVFAERRLRMSLVEDADKIQNALDRAISFDQDWENLLEAMSDSLAVRIVEPEVPSSEDVLILAEVLEGEFGIATELSTLAAQGMLFGHEGYEEQVTALHDEDKLRLVQIYQNAALTRSGRVSGERQRHLDYRDALYDVAPQTKEKQVGKARNELNSPDLVNDTWGNYVIQVYMDSRHSEHNLSILPNSSPARSFTGVDKVKGLQIDSQELEGMTLLDSELIPIYRAKALQEYLQLVKEGQPIPEHIRRSFSSTFGELPNNVKSALVYAWPPYLLLDVDEVDILLDTKPWGEPDTTHFLMSHYRVNVGRLSPVRLSMDEPDPALLNTLNQHAKRFKILDGSFSEQDHDRYTQFAYDRTENRSMLIDSYIDYAYVEQRAQYGGERFVSRKDLMGVMRPDTIVRALNLAIENGVGGEVGDHIYPIPGGGFAFSNSKIYQYSMVASPDDLEYVAGNIQRSQEKQGIQLQDYLYVVADLKRRGTSPRTINLVAESMLVGSEFGDNPYETQGEITDILDVFGGHENALEFVLSRPEASRYFSRVGALAVQQFAPQDRADAYKRWMDWMQKSGVPVDAAFDYSSTQTKHARTTAHYPLKNHRHMINSYDRDELYATTLDDYNDLFTRRVPFRVTGMKISEYHVVRGRSTSILPGFEAYDRLRQEERKITGEVSKQTNFYDQPVVKIPQRLGSAPQQIVAEMLHPQVDYFVSEDPIEQRLAAMDEICPLPALAKDIHLERMLRDALGRDSEDVLDQVDQILPRFSSNELVRQYMEAIITKRLETGTFTVEESVDLIEEFFPDASLSRNGLLDQVIEQVAVSSETMSRVMHMRLSEEFEDEDSGDDSPAMSIMNHFLSSRRRNERRETILWLLKMHKKPGNVEAQESNLDGSMDTAPEAFLALNDMQRSEIIERLLLGNDGVMEIIPGQKTVENGGDPLEERRSFLDSIAEVMIPDSVGQHELFRDIFITVMEESDPVRSTQILSKLINKKIAVERKGLVFTPEEALADSLCLAGVVGKKVAQTLAELDIPKEYKDALALSQEQADAVPKRGLYELASQEGLISGEHGVKIVSFGENIGAASNKQAAMVTIEITNQEAADHYGLQIGDQVEVVGKFKRPSAQKVDNLRNDLEILNGVMGVLERHGVAEELPPNFVDQIRIAVEGELEFAKEAEFNQRVAENISKRPMFGDLKLQTPDVLFASDNIVLETRAPGKSLRSWVDSGEHPQLVRTARAAVLSEILYQFLETGEIHADLHMGNIFLDPETNTLTFIDLGMNVTISQDRLPGVRTLFTGLLLGDRSRISESLEGLGWDADIEGMDVAGKGVVRGATGLLLSKLSGGRVGKATSLDTVFVSNILSLLRASQHSETPPPEDISLLIFALSKVEPYLSAVTVPNLMRIARRAGGQN